MNVKGFLCRVNYEGTLKLTIKRKEVKSIMENIRSAKDDNLSMVMKGRGNFKV